MVAKLKMRSSAKESRLFLVLDDSGTAIVQSVMWPNLLDGVGNSAFALCTFFLRCRRHFGNMAVPAIR